MSCRAGLILRNATAFVLAMVAGAFACVLVPAPAHAQAQDVVALRAELHDGYVRIISEWPDTQVGAQITTNAEIVNGVLVMRFPRPVVADPAAVLEALPNLAALARFDPTRRILRIALTRPARVHVSQSFNLTAVDILPANAANDPDDIISPRAEILEREAAEAAARVADLARVAALPPPRLPLRVRSAQAAEYSRIIFDWTTTTTFTLRQTADGVEVEFARDAAPDLARLRVDPPYGVTGVAARHDGDVLTVEFALRADMTARAWSDDERVVVDVMHADASSDPINTLEALALTSDNSAAFPGEVSPEPLPGLAEHDGEGGEEPAHTSVSHGDGLEAAQQLAELEALRAADAGELAGEAEALADTQRDDALRRTRALDEDGYGHVPTVDDLPAHLRAGYDGSDLFDGENPVPESGVVKASVVAGGGDVQVSFSWEAAVGAAAFRRGDAIWLVFDAEAAIDASEIRNANTRHFITAEGYRGDGYSSVRIEAPTTTQVSVVRDGEIWTFTFGEAAVPPRPTNVQRRADELTAPHLFAPLPNVTAVHAMRDTEAGDLLTVATALGPAQGLPARRTFVEVTALASAHGLAFERAADGLHVQMVEDGVRLEREYGLALTSESGRVPVVLEVEEEVEAPADFMDFEAWAAPNGRFIARHDELARAAAYGDTPAEDRMNLARLLVAHELGPEALGVLRMSLIEDPRLLDDQAFRALRGVANVMTGRFKEAETELAAPLLAEAPNAALWRGYVATQFEDWREARRQFDAGQYELYRVRSDWRGRFLVAAATAALELNDLAVAKKAIDEVSASDAPPDVTWRARLLEARFHGVSGDVRRAIRIAEEVAASGYEPIEVEARFERVNLLRSLGEMSVVEATEELETLRFRWRGDAVELEIVRQLGAMYVEADELRRGMSLMKAAAARFPESPVARRLYTDMNDIFRDLFLDGQAEDLDPIEALALWYEFNDLTPIGADGDRMLRRLADRLVAFDLLEQAAELLAHQVRNRLRGLARTQVATDLATVYLMDGRSEDALNVLRSTRVAGTPPALAAERRLLESRALAELGLHEHALELLETDRTPPAMDLKAAIAWDSRNWPHAARLLEGVAGDEWRGDAPLTPDTQSAVMRAAVAYSLSEDTEAVNRLVGRFGRKMSGGEHAASWRTVTGETNVEGVVLRDLARRVAETDSLDAFLTEFRARRAAHAAQAAQLETGGPADEAEG